MLHVTTIYNVNAGEKPRGRAFTVYYRVVRLFKKPFRLPFEMYARRFRTTHRDWYTMKYKFMCETAIHIVSINTLYTTIAGTKSHTILHAAGKSLLLEDRLNNFELENKKTFQIVHVCFVKLPVIALNMENSH